MLYNISHVLSFKTNKNWYFVLAILVFVFFAYALVFRGFFQHDEWSAFANWIQSNNLGFFEHILLFFRPSIAHYTPVGLMLYFLLYKAFGLNFVANAIVSLASHLFIVVLVYFFVNKLVKDRLAALVSSLFFGINAAGYQATSWIGASINTQGATILGIITLISMLLFIESKRSKIKFLVISIIFLFASLLVKEITIGLFLILPLMILFFDKKKEKLKKYIVLFFLFGVMYLVFRFSMISRETLSNQSNEFTPNSQSVVEIIYNTISYPEKEISQSIIPQRAMIQIGDVIAPVFGMTGQAIIETKFIEIFSFVLFIGVVILTLKLKSNVGLFALLFAIINSFVYAISPGRVGIITLADSRNLYFPAIGTMIVMALIVLKILKQNKRIGILILCIWVIFQTVSLNHELKLAADTGQTRKAILDQVYSEHPNLPDKVIIYTRSDSSYYGMPDTEKILPFETGFGQALLVWYQERESFPREFFENHFLQYIEDQGYMQDGDRGFGYFRNYDDLKDAIVKNKLDPKIIIGYSWNSKLNKLEDITALVQKSF